MNKETLMRKLELLREEYRANPDKRKIIEIQGKLLKLGLDKFDKDPDAKKIVETLF